MLITSELQVFYALAWLVAAFIGIGLVVLVAAWRLVRKPSYTVNRYGAARPVRGIAHAVSTGIARSLDFQGRAGRLEFWSTMIATVIFCILYGLGTIVASIAFGLPGIFVFMPIVWLLVVIPTLSVTVRRLHDINRSGWFCLIAFTLGHFVLLYWLCRPSQADDPAELFS